MPQPPDSARPRAKQRAAPAMLLVSLFLGSCGSEPPPNLVLIIGDDVGYRDFGFMGAPYAQTPQLDALAAEGTVFSHGFTPASVCKPSLRAYLTGLHPYQSRFRLRTQGLPIDADIRPRARCREFSVSTATPAFRPESSGSPAFAKRGSARGCRTRAIPWPRAASGSCWGATA